MIKLSKREDYAVILVSVLFKAYKKRLIPLSEVASDYELSLLFLRNVAAELRNHDVIKAVEGKSGGYYLAGDPKKVKMGAVLRIFMKEQAFVCCSKSGQGEDKACPQQDKCAAGNVWRKLNKEIMDRVYNLSISEFLKETNT